MPPEQCRGKQDAARLKTRFCPQNMAGHWCLFVPRFDVVQIAQNVQRFDVVRTVAGAHCPHINV